MQKSEPLVVLIVDDHPVVRSGCRLLLEQVDGAQVHEAVDGETACSLYDQLKPDVVVLDLTLPGMGGLEVLKRLRSRDPHAKVVVFTMRDDSIYGAKALQDGALGYVTKQSAPDDLVTAVRRAAAGEPYLSRDIAEQIALANVRSGRGALDELSPRDIELLRLVSEGNSLKDIAVQLHISYKTVANNCSMLKSKLGARTQSDLVRIAIKHGLCTR